MLFEYDPVKSEANKEKHGIDFEEAKLLWEDEEGVEIRSRAVLVTEEERWIRIARIYQKIWTAVFTYRGKVIRLISVRSARKEEKILYEQNYYGN